MNPERLSRQPVHQPSGGFQGQAVDIQILAHESLQMRTTLYVMPAKHTGQPIETIERDTERDFLRSAQEAKQYSIIDDIIVTTSRNGASEASDGSLNLSRAGGGNLEPRPDPKRKRPKTSP